jgi:SAM-dependent methyltransferase
MLRRPDIGFIPTPQAAIEQLLDLAHLTSTDVVYDLGSGDGRILIQAAQQYGVRGVGIDIDAQRVQEGREKAHLAGVSDRVTFCQQDLYESDFSAASVVILYLLPHLNLKLRPQLWQQLRPGSRVLSIDFDMGDWQPDQTIKLDQIEEESTVYLWILPLHRIISEVDIL